ncbi:MAG: ribonuclease J, partial [Microcystaceae cyanobacterium]
GVITVAAAINWEGKLMAQPEIHLRGVVTTVERSLLHQLMIRAIEKMLSDRWSEFTQTANGEIEVDWELLREAIESNLKRLMRRELQSQPLVVFLLQMPEEPSPTKSYRRRRSTAEIRV